MQKGSLRRRILFVGRNAALPSVTAVLGESSWNCEAVEQPAEVLGLLRKQRIDLVVMLVESGHEAGCVELARSIKLDARWAHLLVVCLMARGCDDKCMDLYAAGADDCIRSFVGPEETLLRIERAMKVQRAMESLEDADHIIQSLANAVEGKDHCTCGHVDRVSIYCVEMGRRLGLSHEELKALKVGGAVHDIGKIAISDTILNKPGKLTEEEFAIMRRHPVIGYDLLKPLRTFQNILPMVRWHHERPDGTGYPDGLKGEQIPLQARIVAVADVFDAISTDRPYRPAMPLAKCLEILRETAQKGHLDLDLANLLCDVLGQGGSVSATAA